MSCTIFRRVLFGLDKRICEGCAGLGRVLAFDVGGFRGPGARFEAWV